MSRVSSPPKKKQEVVEWRVVGGGEGSLGAKHKSQRLRSFDREDSLF